MLEEIVCIGIGCGLYLVGRLVYRLEGLLTKSFVLCLAEYVETGQMSL